MIKLVASDLDGTILKNGGILENEVEDAVGQGDCGIIQRYWIIL